MSEDQVHDTAAPLRAPLLERHGPVLVGGVFLVVAAVGACLFPLANDEGRHAHLAAQLTHESFWAALFFQKLHPAIALIYSPIGGLGWGGYLALHILLATAGVVLMGKVATRLEGSGWLASLVVAASPAFLLSAMNGQSNTDGLFVFALCLFLYTSPRASSRFFAGVMLGAGLWSRYEFLPLFLALLAHALCRGGARLVLAGFLVFPGVYLAAGAIYHGDVLWAFEFLPVLLRAPQGFDWAFANVNLQREGIAELLAQLALVSALWLTTTFAAWRRSHHVLRWLLPVGAAIFVALVVLPFFRLFYFHYKPRYLIVLLPVIALAVSAAASSSAFTRPKRRAIVITVIGLCALAYIADQPDALFAFAPFAIALAIGLLQPGRPRLATAAFCALGALGAVAAGDVAGRFDAVHGTDGVAAVVPLLRESPPSRPLPRIITNDSTLDLYLSQRGFPGRVRFVPSYDIHFELYSLLNHRNGQYDDLLAAMTPKFYGGTWWPCGLEQRPLRAGDLVVWTKDERSELLVPRAEWTRVTDPLFDAGRLSVRVVSKDGARISMQMRPDLDAGAAAAPCRRPRLSQAQNDSSPQPSWGGAPGSAR